MVKHVVMWILKDKATIDQARRALEGMKGKIPTLESLETGADITGGTASYDMVLITTHKDQAALQAYQVDPVHKEVAALIGTLAAERAAVDFEY